MKTPLLTLVILGALFTGKGQHLTQNTLQYHDSIGSPKADIEQVEWIIGYWRGDAFGGKVQEVWTPPMGGSMMCAFTLIVAHKIKFYEFVTISEENNSLILRLKHFHPDLKGWEPQDKTVDFKLVKITDDRIYFDGFTFEKDGHDAINIYVLLQNGSVNEEIIVRLKKDQL